MVLARAEPLYHKVYYHLKEELMLGSIKGGTKVNEVHLANQLDVSRGPVREAIRRLEQEGLVTRDEKGHMFFYQPTVEDIKHLYQCRSALESLAVELAAQKITDHEVEQLHYFNDETRRVLEEGEELSEAELAKKFIEVTSKFHDMIIIASRNPRLKQQIGSLNSLLYYFRFHNAHGSYRKQNILREHEGIAQAIANRESEQACQLMKEHLEHDLNHVLSIFKEL